jgi:hypothetical protein
MTIRTTDAASVDTVGKVPLAYDDRECDLVFECKPGSHAVSRPLNESFNFRVRFSLPESDRLNYDTAEAEIRLPDGEVFTLKPIGGETIQGSRTLVITGGPYSSAEAAEARGQATVKALLVTGASLTLGVNLGRDASAGGVTEAALRHYSEQTGVRMLEDLPGLTTYDSSVDTKFLGSRVTAVRGIAPENFEKPFLSAVQSEPAMSAKVQLALELCSLSRFEATPRARFLTLVMALEALVEQKNRPTVVRRFLKLIIGLLAGAKMHDSEKDSLRGGLERLKRESIGKSARKLGRKHLDNSEYMGMKPDRFITYIYGLRSELLHEGQITSAGVSLRQVLTATDEFMRDLLLALVGASEA